MRIVITTKDAKPRIISELFCDLELLIACVKDGEIIPGQVAKELNNFVTQVTQALHKGVAQRKKESEET